ncbi:MAG: hypothetical protein R6V85_10815 [Polyangia bacterium]
MGTLETAINDAHGELVGVYYSDLGGGIPSVDSVSDELDGFGWSGGWRITDNAQNTLWLAQDGQNNWLFPGTPSVWVIDTSSMVITASEWEGTYQLDVLAEVEAIDVAN